MAVLWSGSFWLGAWAGVDPSCTIEGGGAVTAFDGRGDVIREWVRQELQRQPRWQPWAMLVCAAGILASLLLGNGPSHRFGGPILYFVALAGSGALLVLSIVLLVLRDRTGAGGR